MSLIKNRKAYFEYQIIQEFVAGIQLTGAEVKSIRRGDSTISDSFVFLKNGEVFTKNMKVSKYKQSHLAEFHDENREKKLLLNRHEINKIEKLIQDKGTTIVPLEVFVVKNRIKVKIAVVKGKKLYDKRESIKKRDIERDLRRIS